MGLANLHDMDHDRVIKCCLTLGSEPRVKSGNGDRCQQEKREGSAG